MRIVLDLQSCQSPSRLRGIGRYSMALAKAFVRRATDYEVIVALNGALGDTIDLIRAEFDGLLPSEHIVVWSQPSDVGFLTTDSRWRIRAAERLRERFLEFALAGCRPRLEPVRRHRRRRQHEHWRSRSGSSHCGYPL